MVTDVERTELVRLTKRAHVNRLLAFLARLVLACADAPTDTTPKGETHWSTRTMAAKAGMSHTMIGRIWRTFVLKPHHITQSFKLAAYVSGLRTARREAGGGLDPGYAGGHEPLPNFIGQRLMSDYYLSAMKPFALAHPRLMSRSAFLRPGHVDTTATCADTVPLSGRTCVS